MMLGYNRGNHLMVKTTHSLMLRTMMTSSMSEAEVPSSEGGDSAGDQGEP
jgi:hypothetical protein